MKPERIKRTLPWLCLIGIFFSACSTVEVSKVKEKEHTAVAILTVDENIDFSDIGEGGKGYIGSFDHIHMDFLAKDLRAKIFEELPESLPVNLIKEDQVVHTDRYQNFLLKDSKKKDERYRRGFKVITPEGYKPYDLATQAMVDKGQKKMFDAVPEKADALLFAAMEYELKEEANFGDYADASVQATFHLEMMDKKGNKILDLSKKKTTSENFRLKMGPQPDEEEVNELLQKANDLAFEAVIKSIEKDF